MMKVNQVLNRPQFMQFELVEHQSQLHTSPLKSSLLEDKPKRRSDDSQLSTLRKAAKQRKGGRRASISLIIPAGVGEDESIRVQRIQRGESPEQFEAQAEIEYANSFVYNNYDIWDLTYSLISANLSRKFLLPIFVIQVSVRYFSIFSLIYITLRSEIQKWYWVFILVFTNFLYFLCIVKISLKPAETQSEYILKQSFNSLEQNAVSQYFQVFSGRKFVTSLLRGMVPPQFSFLYIKDAQRKASIYAMINYIYSSIEAVIYYPFFIIYMLLIVPYQLHLESIIMFYISLLAIMLSEITFIVVSIYLLIHGCRKKGYINSWKDN